LAEEIARVVRGRLTNPLGWRACWLTAIVAFAEDRAGRRFTLAFAATARVVPGHLFDATHAALISDEAVLAAMLEKNPPRRLPCPHDCAMR